MTVTILVARIRRHWVRATGQTAVAQLARLVTSPWSRLGFVLISAVYRGLLSGTTAAFSVVLQVAISRDGVQTYCTGYIVRARQAKASSRYYT